MFEVYHLGSFWECFEDILGGMFWGLFVSLLVYYIYKMKIKILSVYINKQTECDYKIINSNYSINGKYFFHQAQLKFL